MTKPTGYANVFSYLLDNHHVKRVGTIFGYFALGDAYTISGNNPFYQGQLVLVEFCFGQFTRSQKNHWGCRIERRPGHPAPTVFANLKSGQEWKNPQEYKKRA